MSTSTDRTWLAEHRGWEDWCSAALGVLVLLSPIVAGVDPTTVVYVSAGLVGVLITMLALLELMALSRWEEWLELACGGWVVASPLIFGYGGTLRISQFALGAGVMILALLELWQDRGRRFET